MAASGTPQTENRARRQPAGAIRVGTSVEVQNRFTGSWCHGFTIEDVVTDPVHLLYRLRRTSDGLVLPDLFDAASVRPRT